MIRVVAIVLKVLDASLLLLYSILEVNNKEADFASRYIKRDRTPFSNEQFLKDFNKNFPTTQDYNLALI